jgi:hypothetical protein
MKLLRLALLYVIIIMLIGCGKEDQDSPVPGYIKPGDFRPKGMLTKGYTLHYSIVDVPTGTPIDSGNLTCSGEYCLAVYALWSTSDTPVEGIAIKDDDTVAPQMLMKLTRVKGTDWQVRLTYKGIGYKNTLVPFASLDLAFCTTAIPTLPAYDPDGVAASGDEFNVTETFLVKGTLTLLADVVLQTEDKSKTLTLSAGGEIVAIAHGAKGTTTCP